MNLYGYCNNNSTNFVDPYGLKLRLIGTTQEVERMLKYLSKMAGTKIKLCKGGEGYVSGDFSSPTGFEEIERRLKEIIGHDKVIDLKFGNASWTSGGSFDGISKAIVHYDPSKAFYQTTDVIYFISYDSAYQTGEAIIAHEVLGHAYDSLDNKLPKNFKELPEEEKDYWENRARSIGNVVRGLQSPKQKPRRMRDGPNT